MIKSNGEIADKDSLISDSIGQKILAAAIRIIRESGYEELTIRKVAKESGCSNTAIYMRFEDKDALVSAVATLYSEPFLLMMEELYHDEDDYATNLRRIFRSAMQTTRKMDVESIRMQMFYRGRMPVHENPFVQKMAAFFKRSMEKGEIRTMNPEMAAFSIVAAFWGIAYMQNVNKMQNEAVLDEMLNMQVSILLDGMRNGPVQELKEDFWDILKRRGVDVEKALERMKGNKEAYKAFLAEFFEDPDFIMLQESIEAGNVREAFDCAHGLKGMAANLGLDAIHGALSVLVEILRKGILEGAAEAYEEVMNASNQVKELL
ncbi:MAG: TetR family transcriptional regulator [Lachnospiraceae bacterium]|nr:TetR family transcriptional regulator [Lachnospiraceae bacterium]